VTGHIENPVALTDLTDSESLIETLRELRNHDFEKQELISQEIRAGEKTLRTISAPVLGPDGQAVGTVTVLQDVTGFKKLDEMKSDFVNMVAHELRSPLVAIRQQNSVLLEGLAGPLQDKQQDLVGKGLKKTDQLLALINDLLDIAKIEAGKPLQHRVSVDLCHLVEETVGLLETRAQAEGVSLSHACNDVRPILADPKGIEEILSNLVTNAINYSPEGGRVSLTVSGRNEYVEIRVVDRGVGIAPEELPKIFDKFYRVKHPKTRRVIGSGLGLAIVKGIVDAHHGKINVESIPDEGTTIRILLPITE
jgi:signal transduction histidine kinase